MKINLDTTIVIQWFDRKQLSECVNQKVSPKEFKAFKEFIEGTGLADEMSERIRTIFKDGDWKNFVDVDLK
jgi:hypothetical protein